VPSEWSFALSPVYGSFVTNGGFETGSFAGWTVSGPYACVGASVACVGAFGLDSDPGPHSGSYAAYLGGSAPDDLLSQTLATPAGQQLTLSFYLAAPTYLGLNTSLFQLEKHPRPDHI
jgi:serine protease